MDSRQIEATAADWLARRDGGDWGATDEAALEQWLGQSIAHRVALTRMKTLWQQADRLRALGAGVMPGKAPPPGQWRLPVFLGNKPADAPMAATEKPLMLRAGRMRAASLAAGVLLAALGVAGYLAAHDPNAYRTEIGGLEAVPLADGSQLTLNTDSKVQVALTDAERRIDLQRGEAYFDVAKDPTRPFVVQAGSQRIVAVGTRFSVLRTGSDVRVVVTEGRVRVEHGAGPPTPLAAGDIARAGPSGVLLAEHSLVKAEQQVSWRTGYLAFRDTALSEAVAEFNRYNARKLVIGDPSIAALRVGGNLRSTNVTAFVRVLEQGFPVRAVEQDDRIVLTAR